METKYCSGCKEIKEIKNFNKNKCQKDGLANWCKLCKNKEYKKNKQHYAKYRKKYIEKNKEKYNAYHQDYRNNNKEKIAINNKNYRKDNKEKLKNYMRKYALNRLHNDSRFKLDHRLSSAINKDLKRFGLTKQNSGWQEVVGYTIQDLYDHLEKLFKPGMSWKNYGTYWHVDHIKPKSLFEYKSINDDNFKKCWALENLQPLEASENLRKHNKYDPEQNLY